MNNDLFVRESVDWVPHKYQKKTVKYMLEHACAGVFAQPGMGKTSMTLAALTFLFKKKLINKVLIIAPLRVAYTVWPGEVEKYNDFKHLLVEVLHGPGKDAALKRDADIYVINPAGLDWLLGSEKSKGASGRTSVKVNIAAFKKLGFDVLVIDELTAFKNTNSNRFKAMRQVIGTFGRRFGLTGSPAANGLEGLFGQCYMLDQGNALGQYVTHFRTKYFNPHPSGFGHVIKENGAEQIYERLNPLVIQLQAEDHLELPQLVENNIYVELPAAARKIYGMLEDDLFAMVGENAIVATNAAVATGKCRQVAGGALFLTPEVTDLGFKILTGKREWVDIHSEKMTALEDLVEELQGSPLLCFYEFKHELERLRTKFPTAVFAADYKMEKFRDLETKWNSGTIPLMFGHVQSMAHGLNLQGAGNNVCFYSLPWDKEGHEQAIQRVLRQGNKSKRVFVHNIIAHNTIDMTILYLLRSKAKGQSALFSALKELSLKRKLK
jgi:SNF2 family DNA or RNA helicase